MAKYNKNSKQKPKQSDDERDKIFGNSFNTGDLDFGELPDIRVDGAYADSNLDDVYDAEKYNMRLQLAQDCEAAFQASQWATLPRDKNFPKDLRPYIFNDLFTALDKDGQSASEIFIAIAEFMNTSYENVYDAAGFEVKKRLIAELNAEYGSLTKKKRKRLF